MQGTMRIALNAQDMCQHFSGWHYIKVKLYNSLIAFRLMNNIVVTIENSCACRINEPPNLLHTEFCSKKCITLAHHNMHLYRRHNALMHVQGIPLNVETTHIHQFLLFTIENLCFLLVKTGRLQFLSKRPKTPEIWYVLTKCLSLE